MGRVEAVEAWALTARISPRRVVRCSAVDAEGRPVNSYPLIHPVTGGQPSTPWAVHLTDPSGRFLLLCADLDAKDSAQLAAADAARLARLLGEFGLPHVVASSGPTGGRHVWLGLAEPVDAVLVAALARLLKAWLPSLDVSGLLNPATGCVRPPGAPHRLGSRSRVIAGSLSALTHPSVTAGQVASLVEHLAARVPAAVPDRPSSRRRVVATDGMPHLSGPKRALSTACRGALETVPAGDLSSVLWRVLCGAAAAGWQYADIAAVEDAPGLEHARTHRVGSSRTPRPPSGPTSGAAVLRRQWTRAVRTVAEQAADPTLAGDDPTFDTRAELVAECVRAVQGRADASARHWGSSRSGLARRRVLDALCLFHLQAVRTDAVEADIRRLALTCGVDRETARRALIDLAADGWITRTQSAVGRRGASWSIDPTGSIHTRTSRVLSQAVPRPAGTGVALRTLLTRDLTDRLDRGAHDAFAPRGGLGHEAGSVYARLGEPTDTCSLGQGMGWDPTLTLRVLDRLAAHGLVASDGRRWSRTDDEALDQAALDLGTAGRQQQRALQYALERALWAWWQGEVVWMRATRPPAKAIYPGQHPRRAADGRRWPPHPRHQGGRADYAAARRTFDARQPTRRGWRPAPPSMATQG